MRLENNPKKQLHQAEQYFTAREPMAIAVSGGVDSMTLAVLAHAVQPDTEIFHARSPAVPPQASTRVQHYAAQRGWQLQLIDAGEINDPQYVANPANRCYFCKTKLYDQISSHTDRQVASGTNLDDLGDYRPGLVAAAEHQVCHPWVELGISKAGLRAIAGELGLKDLAELPASPCLSSRVTTGIAIDAALLPVINEAEIKIQDMLGERLPLQAVRCRVRSASVAVQLQTRQVFDPDASFFRPVITAVKTLFVARGFGIYVQRVVVEPYARGSAFLIDTLPVR